MQKRSLLDLIHALGPYLLIELLLPGGTLFAVLLYVYRSGALAALQPMPVVVPQVAECQMATVQQRARGLPTLPARNV